MKIVCMGDSLTEGYQIDLSKRWTDELEKVTGIEVINSGICGDTTGGMLARFKEMVIDHKPSHVIIMGGTNDMFAGIGIEVVKGNILAMTRYARYHKIQAIIGIPTPYELDRIAMSSVTSFEENRQTRIDDMRQEVRQYFIEDGLPIIELAKGLGLEDYLSDGLHPNELGHYKMSLTVKAYLDTLVEL